MGPGGTPMKKGFPLFINLILISKPGSSYSSLFVGTSGGFGGRSEASTMCLITFDFVWNILTLKAMF